ncbi:hypothetical protein [Streptomyces sp. NEAU-H3]|uniref:hypothetical protein n=1 Tax=Streptomyces sp. NEAU-H3 TaxID=2720636 RepID=UPI001438DA1B|nr:hypothetical protein [Streptomyces sp. NEAU-H3]NJA56671.1 hypothetical protein [Streptomyces sp. NEAU-H3]
MTDTHHPTFVTFTTGALLLQELDLVDSITADGLREMARRPENQDWWKFGDGPGQTPYIVVGRTRTMETGIFLSMFRQGPRRGGRGRKPKT